jgi:uncharacterized protein YjlB
MPIASFRSAEAHEKSDQVLLMPEGELTGEVGDQRPSLKKGDVIMIPAGAKHRFTNRAQKRSVTLFIRLPLIQQAKMALSAGKNRVVNRVDFVAWRILWRSCRRGLHRAVSSLALAT